MSINPLIQVYVKTPTRALSKGATAFNINPLIQVTNRAGTNAASSQTSQAQAQFQAQSQLNFQNAFWKQVQTLFGQ